MRETERENERETDRETDRDRDRERKALVTSMTTPCQRPHGVRHLNANLNRSYFHARTTHKNEFEKKSIH